jgi:hypothetical protein
MAAPRPWFIAVTAAVALVAGCSSLGETYPRVPPSNATVTRVLMQAPGSAPAPGAAPAASPTSPNALAATPVADIDKADKLGRKGATAQKAKPGGRPATPSTATAAADRPRAPATAAPVYRYLVDLDRGGSRSFDFEADQKLRAGDRVFVTDSGALTVH